MDIKYLPDHTSAEPSPAQQGTGVAVSQPIKFEKDAIFPFQTTLSLLPLIRYWESKLSDEHSIVVMVAKEVREQLKDAPELLQPIEDMAVIEKYRPVVDLMMSAIFPLALCETTVSAAAFPFKFQRFYATPAFERLVVMDGDNRNFRTNVDERMLLMNKTIYASVLVLNKFYVDKPIVLDSQLVLTVPDEQTGLSRYYKVHINGQFVEVLPKRPIKELSAETVHRLVNNIHDIALWQECIPPDNFEIRGFSIITLTDITEQEVLSSLKHDLLQKDAVVSRASFPHLQEKLRILFRIPGLKLGIAAFSEKNQAIINYGRKLWNGILLNAYSEFTCEDMSCSIYQRLSHECNTLIIDDLMELPHHSKIEKKLLEHGVRSLLISPLFYNDELVGVVEIGAPNPGELTALSTVKLAEVLPLFAVAIQRSTEEIENRVQAIIKEEYTAIHPTVEWRFINAAIDRMSNAEKGLNTEEAPIVFSGVYPLYGMSDIRGSSTERNRAIQEDLIEHLLLVKEVIATAYNHQPLPILDELDYRVTRLLNKIREGLNSGDEVGIIDFMRRDVEPVFSHLATSAPALAPAIEQYRSQLDPQLEVVYKRRKAFEESLMLINETVADYMEEEDRKAQLMFPHYFEKYKTDGVEYNIYVGQSMVHDKTFNTMHLKNLRLWQFMTMCEIARRTEALHPRLPIPLKTTQLILAHGSPLSIRFRMDEKKFDVDGAYNIRYEIVKKRIDKALIKDSSERLTQPGKIAIVYAQPKEAAEYHDYIEYLQAKGFLLPEVEQVELEELQGVYGLKALRVTVNYESGIKN